MLQFTSDNILSKSTIITDEWQRYSRLTECGYIHQTLNHSVEFVSSMNPEIHTNNIERLWRTLKNNVSRNTRLSQLETKT